MPPPEPHLIQRRTGRARPAPLRPAAFTYTVESGFLEALLQSEHRTLNPEEADFFYVPVMPSCFMSAVRCAPTAARGLAIGSGLARGPLLAQQPSEMPVGGWAARRRRARPGVPLQGLVFFCTSAPLLVCTRRASTDSVYDFFYGWVNNRASGAVNMLLEAFHWIRAHHPYW